MKTMLTVSAIFLLLALSACGPRKTVSEPSILSAGDSGVPAVGSTPSNEISGPVVETVMPANGPGSGGEAGGETPVSDSAGSSEIGFNDNGKTFHFHVGDSFLLNLGADVYDWSVTVDNQDVFRMKMGVMVIKGAQGIFEALQPGTATLTAGGDPRCRQVVPPCGMPTILFRVTLVVE